MSKFLVTGATGFLGKALVKRLEALSHKVMGLSSRSGDITDPKTFENIPPIKFDRVFHLAGKTFVPDSWANPGEFIRINCEGTRNVLEFCAKASFPITFPSAYVYGIPKRLPIDENVLPQPNNPYALSKYMGEVLCDYFARIHQVSVTMLRFFNVYGEGQDSRFLIPHIINRAVSNQTVLLKDLEPKRDYVYIDDAVDALIATIVWNDPGSRCYNIGSGKAYSVIEVVEMIRSILNVDFEIRCLNEKRRNELNEVRANSEKALVELGWSCSHSLEQGLSKMIEKERCL